MSTRAPGMTRALLEGLAVRLDQAGAGTYRADGSAYLPGETAIVFGILPSSPESAIAITPYQSLDDVGHADRLVSLQVRMRSPGHDPRALWDTADRVFGALHDVGSYALGGVRVAWSARTITAPLGLDDNGRHEQADSYDFQLT